MKHEIGTLTFECNVCGTLCHQPVTALSREVPSCNQCGSTVRMRSMIHALSLALFGRSVSLPNFPVRKDIVGKGTSDWDGYAIPLSKKLAYTNTFYHKAPFLDITNISEADVSNVDFLISTDVFEHVAPPVARSFTNAHKMLKPDGAFIFSVPYALDGNTVEHFPELHEFQIQGVGDARVLINKTSDGRVQKFDKLVFHGGEGDTLEMRVFSEGDLLRDLNDAGFADVQILKEPHFDFGIWWPHKWALPMIARKCLIDIRVVSWGPTMTRVNMPANPQPGGGSALWIKLLGPTPARPLDLLIGDQSADAVTVAGDLITAIIPKALVECRGSYPIAIKDPIAKKVVPVGVFLVCD